MDEQHYLKRLPYSVFGDSYNKTENERHPIFGVSLIAYSRLFVLVEYFFIS